MKMSDAPALGGGKGAAKGAPIVPAAASSRFAMYTTLHPTSVINPESGGGGGSAAAAADKAGTAAEDTGKPVTMEEVQRTLYSIQKEMSTRFGNLRKMFQRIDVDKSGTVSRSEMMTLLMGLDLKAAGVRVKAIEKICETIDDNGNGISFDEFCKLMASNTAVLALVAKKL